MGVELASHQTMAVDVDFISDKDMDYRVRDALKKVLEGDCDSYNQLVSVMHHGKHIDYDKIAELETCLVSLRGAVSCISITHHRSLLIAILGMSLWNYGNDLMKGIMKALLELVVALAVSNGQFIDWCLEVLVSNFLPPVSFLELLKQSRGVYIKDMVLDGVHSKLKNIADLVPLSPMRIEKIVSDKMPNIYLKEDQLVIYTENMLRLENGPLGQLVGSTMLIAIVDNLIDLDVDIAWEDILRDDFTKGIFDMELEELEGIEFTTHQDNDEFSREILMQKFFGGNETAQKLDSLLVLTFEHLKTCYENGRLIQVFETLLQAFYKTILTAYKSKFAQFVMFYACSLDPENCGKRFTDTLLYKFETSPYPQYRMSAVAYLASYLSRAKFVSLSSIATILESLVNWCSDYCKNEDIDINPMAHKVFYAVCQAILYVLCFRMKSMILIPRLKAQLVGMHIEEILKHRLSPLKVVLPSIKEEFIRVANKSGILSVPDIMDSNGQLESEFSMAFGGVERLDMFFPFDPCLLKKSDKFIHPNFVYWSMVKNSEDEVEEEEEDDDDDEEEEDFENGMDIPVGPRSYDEDELDDFDKMSITPNNFSLNQRFGGGGNHMLMPSRIRPSTSPESL